MPSSSALRIAPARGEHVANSPAADAFRRRIQAALPYGAAGRIAIRTGRPERAIYGQIEGEHPLTVAVAVETLRELPEGQARAALAELLAPAGLSVIPTPSPSAAPDVLAANAGLLGAVGAVEAALAAGLADGHLDAREAAEALRAVVEARVRLDGLERRLAGGER